MNILTFGHIPKWAGGRQETGLANVIYNLSLALSNKTGVNVTLASTDVSKEINRKNLRIVGWGKNELIKYLISHPLFCIAYAFYLLCGCRAFLPGDTFLGVLFKGVFLRKVLSEGDFDILHLHEASSWYYVKIVPEKVRIVVTFHGPYGISEDISYRKKYSVLEKNYLTSKRVSAVFFISHSLHKAYAGYYKTIIPTTKVILNAFDKTLFNYIEPKPHKGLNICTIGTIQPRKGQLRVAEAIARTRIKCHYYTIGAGGDEAIRELMAYCEVHQVTHTYMGKKAPSEIRDILAEMDYMILPSSSEGFGLVFVEAIACGVQVILPKELPIANEPQIIKPSINALLLEDSTPESIEKLLTTLTAWTNYDRKAVSDSILACTWDEVANNYLDSFNNCI